MNELGVRSDVERAGVVVNGDNVPRDEQLELGNPCNTTLIDYIITILFPLHHHLFSYLCPHSTCWFSWAYSSLGIHAILRYIIIPAKSLEQSIIYIQFISADVEILALKFIYICTHVSIVPDFRKVFLWIFNTKLGKRHRIGEMRCCGLLVIRG